LLKTIEKSWKIQQNRV